MAVNNISPQNTDRPIWDKTTIYISKNTVHFGSDVYQFRNVTGFGVSPVEAFKVPLQWILLLFIFGIFVITNFQSNQSVGILMILLAIGSFCYNKFWPKTYGLKLYLNSGVPSPIFITKDKKGLKQVVSILYTFMESKQEGTRVVHISDRSIRIEGSVGGSVTAGNIGGSSSSNVGGNVSRND